MPHLSGSASSSLTNAFRPPAEATMPTIGRMSPLGSFPKEGAGGGLWTLGFAAAGARLATGLVSALAAPLDFLDFRGMCATPNELTMGIQYDVTVSRARKQACVNSNRSRLLLRAPALPGTIPEESPRRRSE